MAVNRPTKRFKVDNRRWSLPRSCKKDDHTYRHGRLRPRPSPTLGFFSLPAEVREFIYKYLFAKTRVMYYLENVDSGERNPHCAYDQTLQTKFLVINQREDKRAHVPSKLHHNAILQTCKTCYLEAIDHYFARNHFIVSNTFCYFSPTTLQHLEEFGHRITSLEVSVSFLGQKPVWPELPKLRHLVLSGYPDRPQYTLIHTSSVEKAHRSQMLAEEEPILQLAKMWKDFDPSSKIFAGLSKNVRVTVTYSHQVVFVFRNDRTTQVYTTELWQKTAFRHISVEIDTKVYVTKCARLRYEFISYKDFRKLPSYIEISDEFDYGLW